MVVIHWINWVVDNELETDSQDLTNLITQARLHPQATLQECEDVEGDAFYIFADGEVIPQDITDYLE